MTVSTNSLFTEIAEVLQQIQVLERTVAEQQAEIERLNSVIQADVQVQIDDIKQQVAEQLTTQYNTSFDNLLYTINESVVQLNDIRNGLISSLTQPVEPVQQSVKEPTSFWSTL
jgi:hypothetical protein